MAANSAGIPVASAPGSRPAGVGNVITGGRAYVTVNNNVVAIFDSVTYNVTYGNEPIHILGNYGAQEIAITSQEAINLTCTGFRIVGDGPYGDASVPTLGQLLGLESMTITITDRQTGAVILNVGNCVPVGYNGNHNAKATSKLTINYLGTVIGDESQPSSAPVSDSANNAAVLP